MPEVSVIMPAYNRASLIEASVASVLAQTFVDLELIIVDDGSEDATRDVCARLSARDRRVRYIFQENKGPNAARNTGVRAARGRYIALLDADDLWAPTKLAKQIAVAEHNGDVGVVYCDYACIDDAGRSWSPIYASEVGQTMYESLLYYNVVRGSASAVLIRRECLTQVGQFDESLRWMEDWEMWLRIAAQYKFGKVADVLVYLRQHAGQAQNNNRGMADSQLALLQKIKTSIPAEHRHHLDRVSWHYHLMAAEWYCPTAQRECWRSLVAAVYSYPPGLFSLRTWYFLMLSLAGPLYPQANAMGLVLRQWCYRYLKLNAVTGWRRPVTR